MPSPLLRTFSTSAAHADALPAQQVRTSADLGPRRVEARRGKAILGQGPRGARAPGLSHDLPRAGMPLTLACDPAPGLPMNCRPSLASSGRSSVFAPPPAPPANEALALRRPPANELLLLRRPPLAPPPLPPASACERAIDVWMDLSSTQ